MEFLTEINGLWFNDEAVHGVIISKPNYQGQIFCIRLLELSKFKYSGQTVNAHIDHHIN